MRRSGPRGAPPGRDRARVAADTLGRVSRGRTAKPPTEPFPLEVLAAVPDTVTHEQRLFDAPEELAAAHGAAPTGGVRSAEARS